MFITVLNYATVITFFAFSADLAYQIKHLLKEKNSRGVSVPGLLARTFGTFVLLVKFVTLDDGYLIWGQLLFLILVSWYLYLAVRYK